MNTDPHQSNNDVANNSNMGNSRSTNANGRRCGQAGCSDPFLAHQSFGDLSAGGADERVLDCSDWDNVGDSFTRPQYVGLSTDQLNQVGIDFTLPTSPSTPVGVDGTTTPKPAGITAGKSVNPTNRTNSMSDQHLSEFLLLLIHKMNLLAPPSELGVSFETDAAIDIRWEVKPQQKHGQTSRYTIQCSFRVGLLRDAEAIPFNVRSLTLPLFQSLCVSDSAADEVVDEIQFHEALIGLGFPGSGEDMELLDDQE